MIFSPWVRDASRNPCARGGMHRAPVLGDLPPGRDPHLVMLADMFEEPNQAGDAPRPTDQAIMQGERHQFGAIGAFGVERVEAVDHILSEVVANGKAAVL